LFAADVSKLGIRELAKPGEKVDAAQVPALAKAAYASVDSANPVYRLSDIAFLGADRKEKLDLYFPAGEARADRAAVVFIHGGGFTGGDKAEYRSSSVSADLCRAGYVVVSCNYVLGSKEKAGVWPQNIKDCRDAVRWVRAHAKELGVNIQQVRGTGRGGRVTASDLQAVSQGAVDVARETTASRVVMAQPINRTTVNDNAVTTTSAAISVAYPNVNREGVKECIPFRGIRRKIAQALDLSVKTAVHFTVVDSADVTKLDRKRKEYAAALGTKLSMLPFVMLAVCKALRKHPTLNANVDDANEEILIKDPIHLGCAVDTDHGLMVPVLRNAHQKNVGELASLVKELAESCKNRSVARENLVGGTFTMSNVGSYGGTFATPIINYPEVAILAVGRAKEQVLTKDGAFYAGLVLPLSLSCDHRIVDGAEGARFLNTVLGFLENPDKLLA